MALTNAEKQARHRERLATRGLVAVTVWVPAAAQESVQRAAEILRENPELEVARLVSRRTGRLVGMKKGAP